MQHWNDIKDWNLDPIVQEAFEKIDKKAQNISFSDEEAFQDYLIWTVSYISSSLDRFEEQGYSREELKSKFQDLNMYIVEKYIMRSG